MRNGSLKLRKFRESAGSIPATPRRCGRQRHRQNMPADTPSSYFKRTQEYHNPTPGPLIAELESRFTTLHCTALNGVALIPSALCDVAVSESELERFVDNYSKNLPCPLTVEAELECWRRKWKQPSQTLPNTTTQTLMHTATYPNIKMLLRLLLSLPVTSCTTKRAFSGLKRLKTYLRSSMGNEHLSGLALITIDVDTAITMYAIRDPTRMARIYILDA